MVLSHQNSNIQILLVENNLQQAELLRAAFLQNDVENEIHVLKNRDNALAFFNQNSPRIVFIDISDENTSGLELLADIRENNSLVGSLIYVIGDTNEHALIEKAYHLFVAGYLEKTDRLDQYVTKVEVLKRFWEINQFI